MRILHICSYYVGSSLYERLFDSLRKVVKDIDVYVFTDKNFTINEKASSNVTISKCYNKLDRLIFHLKHAKVLKDIKDKLEISKYDITHAHSLFSNGYIAYRLNQEYNTPYIVAVRNTDVNLFFKKMIHLRTMGVNILRNAKKVVFISKPYEEYVIGKFIPEKYKKEIEGKSVVIPNGIDRFWLENKFRGRHLRKDNKINLIYAGRIDANKNIETTIKACRLLIEQGYEVNFKVVGKIADRKYRAFIRECPFVQYIPYCPKEDLINHYREADIFVMPSKHETFGLVYAEAMSQGLPVIYTRGQGFDGNFKEGEVGYSVRYNSAEEITDRIKDILANYETISSNCVANVDKFDWIKITNEYLSIYESIIK